MRMIRSDKRGDTSALQVIGGLVLVLVLVFGLWWAFSGSLGESTNIYEGVSVSSSRVAIDSCNSACSYINGEDISDPLGAQFTGRGGAINSYCTEIKPFKDGSGKNIPGTTCAGAVTNAKLQVSDCTVVC